MICIFLFKKFNISIPAPVRGRTLDNILDYFQSRLISIPAPVRGRTAPGK